MCVGCIEIDQLHNEFLRWVKCIETDQLHNEFLKWVKYSLVEFIHQTGHGCVFTATEIYNVNTQGGRMCNTYIYRERERERETERETETDRQTDRQRLA